MIRKKLKIFTTLVKTYRVSKDNLTFYIIWFIFHLFSSFMVAFDLLITLPDLNGMKFYLPHQSQRAPKKPTQINLKFQYL